MKACVNIFSASWISYIYLIVLITIINKVRDFVTNRINSLDKDFKYCLQELDSSSTPAYAPFPAMMTAKSFSLCWLSCIKAIPIIPRFCDTLQFLFRIINKLGNALFIFTLAKELRQKL